MRVASRSPAEWLKIFQTALILAFEVIMQPLVFIALFSHFCPICDAQTDFITSDAFILKILWQLVDQKLLFISASCLGYPIIDITNFVILYRMASQPL